MKHKLLTYFWLWHIALAMNGVLSGTRSLEQTPQMSITQRNTWIRITYGWLRSSEPRPCWERLLDGTAQHKCESISYIGTNGKVRAKIKEHLLLEYGTHCSHANTVLEGILAYRVSKFLAQVGFVGCVCVCVCRWAFGSPPTPSNSGPWFNEGRCWPLFVYGW